MAESRHMQMGALCSYHRISNMTIRDFRMAATRIHEQEEELGYKTNGIL